MPGSDDTNKKLEELVDGITDTMTPEYREDLKKAGLDPDAVEDKLIEIQEKLKDQLGLN